MEDLEGGTPTHSRTEKNALCLPGVQKDGCKAQTDVPICCGLDLYLGKEVGCVFIPSVFMIAIWVFQHNQRWPSCYTAHVRGGVGPELVGSDHLHQPSKAMSILELLTPVV